MEFLINAAIAGTVTALVILLMKRVFKNVFTPKWHLLIWLVLFIRLMMPVLPEGEYSIYNLLPTFDGTSITQSAGAMNTAQVTGNVQVGAAQEPGTINLEDNTAVNDVVATGTVNSSADSTMASSLSAFWGNMDSMIGTFLRGAGLDTVIFAAWLGGALLLAAFFVVSYLRLKKSLKDLPEVTEGSTYIVFRQCKAKLGLEKKNISLKAGAGTPMLVGLAKPKVYMADGYSESELEHVLTHELCHYKNHDTLINAICTAVLCLNWFNPVIWICFKTIRRDLEMYCDYRAVKLLGEKKSYAQVLLKTATAKNSFVFATTSLQNGEAEVTQRIKKLAYYKQPKFWVTVGAVVIALIIAVVCLTDGADKQGEMVYIGASNEYMMEAPNSWVKEDYSGITNENGVLQQVEFYNSGTLMAAAKLEDLCGQLEEQNYFEDGDFDALDLVRLYEEGKGYSNVHAEIIYMSETDDATIIDSLFLVKGQNPDGISETLVLRIPELFDDTSFVIWTENDRAKEADLISAAESIIAPVSPESYRPVKVLDLGWNARAQGNHYDDIEKDVQSLITEYFDNYLETDMPRESDIEDYKIISMVPLSEAVGDIPSIVDGGVIEGEKVPWNIIYPTARVYKTDYELIPRDKEHFADFAGGGFEITSEGNKLYTEAYGVFVDFSDDGEQSKGVFLGFLHPANLAEYGVDYSTLMLLDNWYETVVVPTALENCHIKYIGAASDVSKLAGTLPLREYWHGMELQTTEEPYGATIWADFFGAEPEVNDNLIWSNLPEGGDVSQTVGITKGTITGGERSVQLNPYILRQMEKSAGWIMSGIDNAGSISYQVLATAANEIGDYTYTLKREDVELTYCGQLGEVELSFINDAYLLTMSSVRGITFKATYPDAKGIVISNDAGQILAEGDNYIWSPLSESGDWRADGAQITVKAYSEDNRVMATNTFNIIENEGVYTVAK